MLCAFLAILTLLALLTHTCSWQTVRKKKSSTFVYSILVNSHGVYFVHVCGAVINAELLQGALQLTTGYDHYRSSTRIRRCTQNSW